LKTIRLKMRRDADGVSATRAGDHRMSRLVIPIPRSVKDQVRSCIVLLSMDNSQPSISAFITEGESGDAYIDEGNVYFVLLQQHTLGQNLRVQLECYSAPIPSEENFIARSGVSEQIMFEPSLADSLDDLPEAQMNPGAISELISKLPWLRRTGTDDDLPTWDGEAWPGGSAEADGWNYFINKYLEFMEETE